MGLYRRKDSDVWWMSFVVNGVQYRRSTDTEDDKLAEDIFAKVRTQIKEASGSTLTNPKLGPLTR
jgi:hypothetical protein